MKLKNHQILSAISAINALTPFKLKNGHATWNLSRNLALLEDLKEPVDTEKQRIIREAFGNDRPLVTHPGYFEFDTRHDELMKREQDMEKVFKITKADLDLDNNPIPPETLKSLRFMIEDWDSNGAPETPKT